MPWPYVKRSTYNALRKEHAVLVNTMDMLRGSIGELRVRAESAERAYHGLVEQMLTPPQAPPPLAPADPETDRVEKLSVETVNKMAEQFVRDGYSPDVAQREAQSLVEMAERMWMGS
jgi:hypothetical protein